ncbi:MAG: hypothetical protein JJE04_07140 [Acidobacteriia bacterium]|nr:hypothetical protein [Terriglobia bacterium]
MTKTAVASLQMAALFKTAKGSARVVAGLLMLAVALTLSAQQQKKKNAGKENKKKAGGIEAPAPGNAPLPKLAGQISGQLFSDAGKQSDWPAIAYSRDGSLWAAFLEWDDKDADRLLVRRRDPQGSWGAPIQIEDGLADHYLPAITAQGDGVTIVWSAQVDGNFELFASDVTAAGKASKPQRLTSAPHGDFNVRAVSDAKGNVTIAWQSFRNGNADVYARRRTGKSWGKEIRVSTSEKGDWEPAIALDARGAAWISWDSYHHGNYDVFLRSFDNGKLGAPVAITTESTAQFHSTVAVDSADRVWVAWDDAGENWGKDYSTSSAAPGSRGLHYSRTLGLRVYANGRAQNPSADLSPILTERMTRYAELPHLSVDGAGALVMVFRHWTYTLPNEIFHFYSTTLSGAQWSWPTQLTSSSGQNSQRASLAMNPQGGIDVAYASDGRSITVKPTSQAHSLHYGAYVSALPKGGGPPVVTLAGVTAPTAGTHPPRRARHNMSANGKTYKLLMGDSHRHTDIRGHSGVDGSVLDTYRYAIDAAQLDFLGTSDHNEVTGGGWPDGLRDYQWYWVQKAVDLFTHSPVFTAVYSYEHSMASPGGHRNVLFLKRGAPLRMIDRGKGYDSLDNNPPAMWKFWEEKVLSQPGQKSVIVPHTFAAGPLADWNWPNARFDCLLEIYQGARGSYEAFNQPKGELRGRTQTDQPGHFAQDALAKGNIYGFVSFSDHGSTHNSWAAVWAQTEDRRGILDRMYDRRTFAATDEIILKVTAGNHMPGEEWDAPLNAPVRMQARIDAPDTLERIDIVKDGKFVYTTRPNARTATLTWQDTETKPGKSYYYVRVFQRDTENPEGDPEIAWASPFYVTYK